jgi:hypothetical protein
MDRFQFHPLLLFWAIDFGPVTVEIDRFLVLLSYSFPWWEEQVIHSVVEALPEGNKQHDGTA